MTNPDTCDCCHAPIEDTHYSPAYGDVRGLVCFCADCADLFDRVGKRAAEEIMPIIQAATAPTTTPISDAIEKEMRSRGLLRLSEAA